jgi:hypothetical protein
MQKHKFAATCPDALFVESVPVPPELEKHYVDILQPLRTGMHYVIHRYHRMQKHKFGVTCPGLLFMEIALRNPLPHTPDHEK